MSTACYKADIREESTWTAATDPKLTFTAAQSDAIFSSRQAKIGLGQAVRSSSPMFDPKIVVRLFFGLLFGQWHAIGDDDVTDINIDKLAALVVSGRNGDELPSFRLKYRLRPAAGVSHGT